MPVQQGRCVNFGRCPKADSGEEILVGSGIRFVCPFHSCGELLVPVTPLKRSFSLRRYFLVGGLAVIVLILGVAFGYPWHSSMAANAPSASVQSASFKPVDVNVTDTCHEKNWPTATEKDFLSINCVGKGVVSYDKRLEYVYSLNQVKNWSTVKREDPRLRDCAGLYECEERAQSVNTPRLLPESRKPLTISHAAAEVPSKRVDWGNSSCQSVTSSWESEDPRLSTSTCGGLSMLECSHIKRCLGLHDINVGPGSSTIEP